MFSTTAKRSILTRGARFSSGSINIHKSHIPPGTGVFKPESSPRSLRSSRSEFKPPGTAVFKPESSARSSRAPPGTGMSKPESSPRSEVSQTSVTVLLPSSCSTSKKLFVTVKLPSGKFLVIPESSVSTTKYVKEKRNNGDDLGEVAGVFEELTSTALQTPADLIFEQSDSDLLRSPSS